MNKQFLRNGPPLALAILVLGLCLATISGLWRQHQIHNENEARFQGSANRVSADVATRFLKPIYGLNGLKGMYVAKSSVKRDEFRIYVESRNLSKDFPGVRGFAFIEHVMRADLNTFLAAARDDGAPQFAIRQLDDRDHEDLYVVKLIEPAADNHGATGLDIGSEALRLATIKQTIDSGEPTMSEAITLVQDARKTAGVLLFVPVYKHGVPSATADERKAALLGLLNAPIVIDELLDGLPDVVDGAVDFALYENAKTVLYDTAHVTRLRTNQTLLADPHLVTTQTLMLAGRAMTLRVSSTPSFDAAIDHSSPWLVFAGIALLSALLALLSRQQASFRLRAETRALQITEELREASTKISHLNQRFCLATGSVHIGIWDYLIPEDRLVWDKQMYALYGVGEEEFSEAYETWQDRLHPDDKARGDEEMKQAMQGIDQYDTEFRVIWPTGEIHYIKAAAVVLRDEAGNPLRMIGANYDITERKQAEESQMVLTRAIEQSPVPILVTDVKAAIQYANPKYEEVTGYRLDEIIGKNPRIFSSQEKSKADYQTMWDTLLSGQNWQGEFHNRRKDGTLFWVRASISPVRNRKGVLTNFVAIKEDITLFKKISGLLINANTELAFQSEEKGKRAEELVIANTELAELAFQSEEKDKRADELVIANAAAQAANIAKSRFLATMSHEIRTPMNGILGMAQMLLMPQITDAQRLDYARVVFTSGQTLLNLLNDILDLSKIEAGKYQLETAAFDPCQLVHETQTLFASTTSEKGLRIESCWNGPAGQYYLGDHLRLHQMLSNLVSNAIKFTEQGVIRIEAREIECDQTTAILEFSVSDTGIGILEDKHALLFLPFSQADSSTTRKYGGSGLGLSIVRNMAQLMNGDVGLDSQAGKGSRFWFRISAKRVLAGAQSSTTERENDGILNTAPTGSRASCRVLVVEDVLANRHVIEAMLASLGLSVTLAEDGQQGVEAIVGGDPADLILMDVQMPVMDGLAAAARIRQWEKETGRARRPIIALTGQAFETDRQECLVAGMDDVLIKPVFIKNLRTLLAKWLPASHHDTAEIAGPTAVPTPTDKPVDVERVGALIEVLIPMLETNKYEAISRFNALKVAVAGTVLAEEFMETGRLLDGLRFAEALERLRHVNLPSALEKSQHD